jgi:hypothetical protein
MIFVCYFAGSSREGLKVHAADEFDVLLQYRFKDLNVTVKNESHIRGLKI